jgi:hypothetical protein
MMLRTAHCVEREYRHQHQCRHKPLHYVGPGYRQEPARNHSRQCRPRRRSWYKSGTRSRTITPICRPELVCRTRRRSE